MPLLNQVTTKNVFTVDAHWCYVPKKNNSCTFEKSSGEIIKTSTVEEIIVVDRVNSYLVFETRNSIYKIKAHSILEGII